MHDFSGWSGLDVLQPEQGNIIGTFFFENKFSSKKAVSILFDDYSKRKKKKKKEKSGYGR